MTSADWIDLLNLIPLDQHCQLILITRSGLELAIDSLQRTERSFLAFRGRVCGNTDDGRLFFIPYAEITCVYINRFVKEQDVDDLLGEAASSESSSGVYQSSDSDTPVRPAPLLATPVILPPIPIGAERLMATPNLAAPTKPATPGPTLPTILTPAPPQPVTPKPVMPMPSISANAGGVDPKGSILERLRAQRNTSSRPR